MSQEDKSDGMTRRGLLASAAAMGASAALGRQVRNGTRGERTKVADVNVALIGFGRQGRTLLTNLLKMKRIRIRAVCDLVPYRRSYARRVAQRYKHDANAFEDYREMLATVKDLDAAVIATPDWMHAEHAIACMGAGLHAYCETPISDTLAKAAQMVRFARLSGRLLQIGHQRRSNPRYITARKYVRQKKALGRLTHVTGQWHRFRWSPFRCPTRHNLPGETLAEYGYGSMAELCNWRFYRKYTGGPIADFGSHQVDVFNWFLGSRPRAVQANGGCDYYAGREFYDNINVMYEWDCDQAGKKTVVRGFYQILTTTSYGGHFETFMGDEGSLTISESRCVNSYIRREENVKDAKWARGEEILVTSEEEQNEADRTARRRRRRQCYLRPSCPAPGRLYPIRVTAELERPPHRWHLENFFAAVRDPGKVKLNCPGEIGFEAAASVLPAGAALVKGQRIVLPEDTYKVS